MRCVTGISQEFGWVDLDREPMVRRPLADGSPTTRFFGLSGLI